MKRIEYIIKTLAPVTFAEKNNGSILYNTNKYVSGSALRGMFADRFIKERKLVNAHENEDFYNIFLSGKVRFLPAYPIGRSKNEGFKPYVLPLSFMRSKDGEILKDISGGEKLKTGFKKITGFALREGSEIYKVNVDTQIEFHMARSGEAGRIHGSSRDGKVFNYEYIEPYQYFKGWIITDDDMAEKVRENLKTLKKIYIGRSRSAQYGECSLEVGEAADCAADCDEENFNVRLGNGRCYLYAYTPYIPLYEWQRVDTAAENLCREINGRLREKAAAAEVKRGDSFFAAAEEYSGYVGVWKVRRERVFAISAGSLLEIRLESADNETITALNEILYGGLGARTEEGFGQFRLYQPVDDLSLEELKSKRPEDYILSDEVKKQAGKIIKERILLEIKKRAVNDGDKCFKFMSKSKTVLNRLENLMSSDKSKQKIQTEIKNFNKAAIDNLGGMFINNDSLFDILIEKDNVKLPYTNIKWETGLGLNDRDQKLIKEMKKDLGENVFNVDENTLYREYFFWFVRHAKKVVRERNEN